MSAGSHNISIEQGALFEMVVLIQDNQSTPEPIDLTGYTFEGQVRESSSAKNPAASFDFEILDQVSLSTKGKVRVTIPAAETGLIAMPVAQPGQRASKAFIYDISYGPTGGEKFRLLQGTATVSAEATR